MQEIPLFPLNTVLFPGMPLTLHIFEERYKLMITECIEKREPFGVALIANNKTDTNPNAIPHRVGCTAQITRVQPLREGRMEITAVGRERFEVLSLDQERPYLVGKVEILPLKEDDPLQLLRSAQQLRHYVEAYLNLLRTMGKINVESSQLPQSPMALGYLSAVLLQTPLKDKQSLLCAASAGEFLEILRSTYKRETALLNVLRQPPTDMDYYNLYSLS
jgi:Lon protease-like protein